MFDSEVTPAMRVEGDRFITEPSYVAIENLRWLIFGIGALLKFSQTFFERGWVEGKGKIFYQRTKLCCHSYIGTYQSTFESFMNGKGHFFGTQNHSK